MTGGAKPETVTLDIAEDYAVSYRETGGTIYDFALRRILVLDDKARTDRNSSLYAYVDFAVYETANRRAQRALMKDIKSDGGATPHARPVLGAVRAACDGAARRLAHHTCARADKDGSVHFSYDKKEVASYALSKQAMTKAESATLAKYLRFTASAASHHHRRNRGQRADAVAHRLRPAADAQTPAGRVGVREAAGGEGVYPIRAGIKPDITVSGTDRGLDGRARSSARHAGGDRGQRAGAQERGRFSSFHRRRDGQEAAFPGHGAGVRVQSAYGMAAADCVAPCHSLKDVFTAANADPRAQALVKSLLARQPRRTHGRDQGADRSEARRSEQSLCGRRFPRQ